jgi:hypothetical protein
MGLRRHEKEQFFELGYVIKKGVYAPSDLRPVSDGLTAAIQEKCDELVTAGQLDRDFSEEPFETRLGKIYHHDPESGQKVLESIWSGKFHGPTMLAALRHPPLIECIQDLVGPDVMATSIYRIRPKVPKYYQAEVPWHQDSGYGMRHCEEEFVVTCWIPLVDVNVNNGCLWIIPNVHKSGIIRHYTEGHAKYLEIAPEDVPEGAIPIEIEAGSALFLTGKTPHASFENESDVVRWSMDLRYQDFDVPNNWNEVPEDYTQDRDPVTMACSPGEAYFVIHDSKNPDYDVTDPEVFGELRELWHNAKLPSFEKRWTPLGERERR